MRKLYKHFSFIVFFLIHFSAINQCAYSQVLTIAVEDNAAPWSQKDGTGYANDVVRAAFKAVGQNIKLEVVPYSRAKEMLVSGKVPACFNMSKTENFKGQVLFPNLPLFSYDIDYLVKKEKVSKAENQYQIKKGSVLGTVIGYEYPPVVSDLQKKGILLFEASESEITNLKKLALGRIDYSLLSHNNTKPTELLIAKAGATDKIKIAFNCGHQNSYIGFSSKNPMGKVALEKFNRGMEIITKNGTFKKIEQVWQNKALLEIKNLQLNKTRN